MLRRWWINDIIEKTQKDCSEKENMPRPEFTKKEKEENIPLLDRVSVFANVALQQLGFGELPFVETYITTSAKLDGIQNILNRISDKIRINKTIGNDDSMIELKYVPIEKLEEVKGWLHKVKIAVHAIKPSYGKTLPRTSFTIVVYKGK